jgi:quercetin dioxygenase-like cupin family protein
MAKLEAEFGFIIPLGEEDEVSTTVLEILPGREIKKHYHKKTRETEIVLRGEVFANGTRKREGDVLVWPVNEYHEYENRSHDVTRILCVATPKYDPSDTYEV